MKDIQRQDLAIMSRQSNIEEEDISKIFREEIYSDRKMWEKFLRLFFLTLGIAFTVSGIIFFFAYNWTDLNKFVKIGLTQILIITTTGIVLFGKITKITQNIILTGSAVLVGALFAVYGQIYQTGANAYDFFLGWTLFISLWVFISGFAPLWLLFLLLINTTFYLYADQMAEDWSVIFVFTVHFLINVTAVVAAVLISKYNKNAHVPNWFLHTVSLAAIAFATTGIFIGIIDSYKTEIFALIISVIILYPLGIWYTLKVKQGFYLAVIPLSLIIIISTRIFEISQDSEIFLYVGIFIIISITLVIKNLLNFQKKWRNEK